MTILENHSGVHMPTRAGPCLLPRGGGKPHYVLWSLKNKAASDYTRPNKLRLDERWRRGLAAVWMQFMGLLEYKTLGQLYKVDIYGSTRLRLSSAACRSTVVAGSLQGDDNFFLAFFSFSFPLPCISFPLPCKKCLLVLSW